jgi:hypothetical protein
LTVNLPPFSPAPSDANCMSTILSLSADDLQL